jgi:glycosyltransferase involved in cell wall biosynthesis
VTRELARMGYNSVLATGLCAAQDGDMSYLLEPDDSVCWIPEMSRNPSPWRDLIALLRLYREMRRLRPDVVHTHTAKAGALGRVAALLAGVPVVVHTFHGNVLSSYFSKPVSRLVAAIERLLALGTDAICVLSPQQQTEIAQTYHIAPREKVYVVPLGMDLEKFVETPLPSNSGGKITAGWLGRFVAVKDIPLLAQVIEETLRRTDRVQFVIAGDGPESGLVKSLAARFGEGRVAYVGWQRDVLPVIAKCDLLIQTSRNEGTPVALIQGMAARRPFLATAVGGIPDMAGEHLSSSSDIRWHRRGVLAPHRADAFASVLCELAQDTSRLEPMGIAGQAYVLSQNSLSSLMVRLDQLYTQLLRRAAVRSLKHVLVET